MVESNKSKGVLWNERNLTHHPIAGSVPFRFLQPEGRGQSLQLPAVVVTTIEVQGAPPLALVMTFGWEEGVTSDPVPFRVLLLLGVDQSQFTKNHRVNFSEEGARGYPTRGVRNGCNTDSTP